MKKADEIFESFLKETPLIIAHRGFSAVAPENTLSAFKLAIENKADMIELDIRMSKDKSVVVIHDSKLDRTTDGTGRVRAKYIWNLKKLDAGSWFDKSFKGEKIPTLEEVFRLVKGRIPIDIEIKKTRGKEEIEERVLGLIYSFEMVDKVIISSFNPRVIRKIRKLSSEIPTGFIYHYPVYFNPGRILKRLGANVLIHNYKFTTEKLVKKVHTSGFRIFVYSVNSFDKIKRMVELGVDGIITDDVKLARGVVLGI